jgi:hypothetical protein
MISIGVEKSKMLYIIISAIAFGVMLNLRSDYYFFALVIGIVLIIFGLIKRHTKKLSLYALYWLSIVFITLMLSKNFGFYGIITAYVISKFVFILAVLFNYKKSLSLVE